MIGREASRDWYQAYNEKKRLEAVAEAAEQAARVQAKTGALVEGTANVLSTLGCRQYWLSHILPRQSHETLGVFAGQVALPARTSAAVSNRKSIDSMRYASVGWLGCLT